MQTTARWRESAAEEEEWRDSCTVGNIRRGRCASTQTRRTVSTVSWIFLVYTMLSLFRCEAQQKTPEDSWIGFSVFTLLI